MSNDVSCVKSSLSSNQSWFQAKLGRRLNQIRTTDIDTSNESTTIRGERSVVPTLVSSAWNPNAAA